MADFLDELARTAWSNVRTGYYEVNSIFFGNRESLKEAIKHNPVAIIAEIKFASPSKGPIRRDESYVSIAKKMVRGGAVGISVLTEPRLFKGSLNGFLEVRKNLKVPLLMKDIIVHESQVDCAAKIGADAVLLIKALFDRGHSDKGLDYMIRYAHSLGLEVLAEAHTFDEFEDLLGTEADMIGINNRDLRSLKVDIGRTVSILERIEELPRDKVIVSESGINSRRDVELLTNQGVKAFLVGSSIMRAADIEGKVKELIGKG
jgi:indole-3-glycerol phosphate synthase